MEESGAECVWMVTISNNLFGGTTGQVLKDWGAELKKLCARFTITTPPSKFGLPNEVITFFETRTEQSAFVE